MKNIRQKFINTGHIEGVSFLVLLFIAMPLKYFFDMPLAVRIVGSIHGVLFIAYVILLAAVYFKFKLAFSKSIILFLLSLLPFGTFYLHKFLPAKEY
ncbi:MAG: DUF3817 domain-containing protein [Bacteroidia bacterium]